MPTSPEQTRSPAILQPVSPLDFQRLGELFTDEDFANIGTLAYIPPIENAFPFDGISVGQPESLAIRLDEEVAGILNLIPYGDVVELDIWIDESHRGQGNGSRIVRTAAVEVFARGYQELRARVGAGNQTSQHMLESVGFKYRGHIEASGQSGILYSLSPAAYIVDMVRRFP